jgi:Bacterial regulatory protein, arsR family
MSTGALDPLIHDPRRLRVVAALAALPDGDALSVTRLQGMLGLTPASLITHLRELDHAGYVRTERPAAIEPRPPPRSPATAGPRWVATPPCCASCPAWPGRTIRHQHPTCALAMLTGTRPPRPWVSTSRKAGSR